MPGYQEYNKTLMSFNNHKCKPLKSDSKHKHKQTKQCSRLPKPNYKHSRKPILIYSPITQLPISSCEASGVPLVEADSKPPEGCSGFETGFSCPECPVVSSTEVSAEIVHYGHEFISTFVCCLGSFSHGLAFGFSSPAVPKLVTAGFLTEDQASWFECLLIAGAIAGGLAVGSLIHLVGRKGSILVATVPFLAGWLCLTFSRTYVPLCTGRFLVGIAYGMVEIACPVYVAETVSEEMLSSATMWLVVSDASGSLVQYVLGLFLDVGVMSAVSMIPAVAMLLGMFCVPESPRWLIHTGNKLGALQSIQWLRMVSKKGAKSEFIRINTSAACQSVCYSETFNEMPKVLLPLVACGTLFVFQQFSGITPIMFNAEWILKDTSSGAVIANQPFRSGQLSAVILAATKLLTTVFGLLLIDRLGKRLLFVSSGILMAASLSTVGLFLCLGDSDSDTLGWLPLVSLFVFVSAHSVGWCSIPRAVITEISSQKVKGLASGIGATAAWFSAFLVTQQFLTWYRYIDIHGVFLIYGIFCLAGSLFALKYLPEVKTKTSYNTSSI